MSKQTSSRGVNWLLALATYATLSGMYYLWQIKGMEQAGNVFMFYVWLAAVSGCFSVFMTPQASNHTPRPKSYRVMSAITVPLMVIGTVWAGHVVAGSLYVIGVLAMHVYRDKAKEAWEAAQ